MDSFKDKHNIEHINQVGTGFIAQGQDLSLKAQVLNDDFTVLKFHNFMKSP